MIEQCSFGSMTIEGRTYTSDLVIFPDGRVMDNWWRVSGHCLSAGDLTLLIESRPKIIVVGSGIYGRMLPDADLIETLAQQRIDLVIEPTETAARTFNATRTERPDVAGCFHLTC